MKPRLVSLIIELVLLSGVHRATAQNAQFFRIAGPTAVTIKTFKGDGTMVWIGATPGATYMVQTASALAGGGNWVNYNQIVASSSSTNVISSFHPPAGMAVIPAGSFTMGDNLDGETDAPVHMVSVSSFYMDKTDVPYSLWQQVFNWASTNGYTFDYPGAGKATNHPVQSLDWYDCAKWCNARSQQAGLTPVYYTDEEFTQPYRNGDVDAVYANWSTNGYRLPTEAEWEKAARGGLSGQRFPWGNTISWSQANYYGDPLSLDSNGYAYDLATAIDFNPAFSDGDNYNELPYTNPVDYFTPNGYGLYDMAGNVWQWCWDWYGTYGSGSDPRGPTSGHDRVNRGNSWRSSAFYCRAANRYYASPLYNGGDLTDAFGFRCVRGL